MNAQIKMGVKLGILATDVNFKAAGSWEEFEVPTARKINYSAGINFEFELMKDLFGLRTGLEFAQKGYNVDLDRFKQVYNDIQQIEGDWTVALQYLEMPVNMYYKLGNFNINAGPYLAYALGGLEEYDVNMLLSDGTSLVLDGSEDLTPVSGEVDANLDDMGGETPLMNYFNQLDFGINLGMGFSLKNFQVNVQYQQGLTNITPDMINEPDFDPADLISKNNVISMELIYYFNFKKKL